MAGAEVIVVILHGCFVLSGSVTEEEPTNTPTSSSTTFNSLTTESISNYYKVMATNKSSDSYADNNNYNLECLNKHHNKKKPKTNYKTLIYHKCCGPGQVSNISDLSKMTEYNCVHSSVKIPNPAIFNHISNTLVTPIYPLNKDIVYGIPVCHNDLNLITLPSYEIPFGHRISMEGELYFPDAVNLKASLADYCIEHVEGQEKEDFRVRYCFQQAPIQEACQNSVCIPFCVGTKHAMDGAQLDHEWQISFYDNTDIVSDCVGYQKYVGSPNCSYLPSSHYHLEASDVKLYVQRNGDLVSESSGNIQRFLPSEYCLGMNSTTNKMLAAVCFPDPSSNSSVNVMYYVKTICMGLSSIFLAVAIIVLVTLPVRKKKNNTQRYTLKEIVNLCHCSTLFLFYTFTVVTQLTHLFPTTKSGCTFIAVATNYFFLSAFFWLNVMCFYMWSSIRFNVVVDSNRDTKKVIMFCLYAFLIPLLFILVGLLIQFTPSVSTSLISPRYGEGICFLVEDEKPYWLYLYGPVAVILVANTIFFISTAIRLYYHSKTCEVSNVENQYTFCLYLRLYLVMGVTWVMELVSWQLTKVHSWADPEAWHLTDLVNALQGVSVFLIFVLSSSRQRKEIIKFVRNSRVSKYISSFKAPKPLLQIKFFNPTIQSRSTEVDHIPTEMQTEEPTGAESRQTIATLEISLPIQK